MDGSGSQAAVNGTNDMVDEDGAGDVLNIQNTGAGTDTVDLNAAGDYAGLLGGTGYALTGSDGMVETWDDTNFQLTGNNDTVGTDASNVDGTAGSSGSIDGTGDTLAEGSGDNFVVYNNGTQADTVAENGTGDYITAADQVAGSNTTINLNGTGDGVGLITGSGYTVDGSNSSVVTLDGVSFAVNGNGDTIGTGANSTGSVTGDGDTLGVGSNTVATVTGTNDAVNENGAGDILDLQNTGTGTDTVTAAAGDTLTVSGDATVTASGVTIDVAGDGASVTVTGTDDQIVTEGNGDVLSVTNDGTSLDNIAENGTGDITNVQDQVDGATSNITFDGTGDYAGLLGGGGYDVDGSNGAVETWDGTNFQVTGNDDTVGTDASDTLTTAGSQGSIIGTGDTLSEGTGDSFVVYNNGTGTDTVAENGLDAGVTAVDQVAGAATTVDLNSTDNYAGLITGSGYTVDGSDGTIVSLDDTSFNVNGNNDNISTGSGSTISDMTGNDDTVTVGTDTIGNIDGSGGTLNEDGTGNVFNFQNTGSAAETVNFNSTDGYAGLLGGNYVVGGSGAGNQVDGSYSTITAQGGTAFNLDGNSNTVTLNGGDTIAVSGGYNDVTTAYGSNNVAFSNSNGDFDTLNGDDNALTLGDGTQANLIGSDSGVILDGGDVFGAYGGGDTVTTNVGGGNQVVFGSTNDDFDTLFGDGNDLGLASGAEANLGGSSNTVYLSEGAVIGAYGGGNTINTSADDQVVLGNTNGDYDAIAGSGDETGATTADGRNAGIFLGNGTQINLSGSNDTVGLGTGSVAGLLSGSGDTFSGSYSTVNGQSNVEATVTGDGNTLQDLGTGAVFNTAGNGMTVELGNNDDANLDGGSNYYVSLGTKNTVTATSNVTGSIIGSGNTITDEGSSAALDFGGDNNQINLGNDDYAGLVNGTNYQMGLGVGDTVDALSNVTANVTGEGDGLENVGTGGVFNVAGNNMTVTLGQDDYAGLVSGIDDQLALGANDLVEAQGGVTANVTGTGDTVANNGDSGAFNVAGNNMTVELGPNEYAGLVSGIDDQVTLQAGDTLDALSNVTANITSAPGGDSLEDLGTGAALNVSGNNMSIIFGNDDYAGLVSGIDDEIALGTNDTVNGQGGVTANVTGTGDLIEDPGTGAAFNIGGGDDTVDLAQDDFAGLVDATNYNLGLGGDDTVDALAGVTGAVSDSSGSYDFDNTGGNNSNISGQNNDSADSIEGLNTDDALDFTIGGTDPVYENEPDYLTSSNENVVNTDSYENQVFDPGADAPTTGDEGLTYTEVDGSLSFPNEYASPVDDSLDFTDDDIYEDDNSNDGNPFYFDPTFMGFVGSIPATNSLAQYDLAHGYAGAAAAADTAFSQAEQSAAGTLATSAATLGLDPVEPSWVDNTVTWSFAAGPSTGASPFSGAMAQPEQAVVEGAMQAWANASGLNLQQVADPTKADFSIGWGDFDTADTNLIGYTSLIRAADALQSGGVVRLEDPNETALTTGTDGELAYSGSGATLYQVALHEIGHALGLSDNSDPNSVMYFSLGGSNTTLDDTDRAAIQQLYGAPTSASEATIAQNQQAGDPTSLAAVASTMFPAQQQLVHG